MSSSTDWGIDTSKPIPKWTPRVTKGIAIESHKQVVSKIYPSLKSKPAKAKVNYGKKLKRKRQKALLKQEKEAKKAKWLAVCGSIKTADLKRREGK